MQFEAMTVRHEVVMRFNGDKPSIRLELRDGDDTQDNIATLKDMFARRDDAKQFVVRSVMESKQSDITNYSPAKYHPGCGDMLNGDTDHNFAKSVGLPFAEID